jgi:hypothetical protein
MSASTSHCSGPAPVPALSILSPMCVTAIACASRSPQKPRLRAFAHVHYRQVEQRPADFPFNPSTRSFPEVVS